MSLAHRGTISEPTLDEGTGWWSAELIVDELDPVIFDHSVDHVPGMLILHGIAELVELVSRERCATSFFDLHFTRFVEKDVPVSVAIVQTMAPHAWQVEMTQAGRVVCAGTVATIALKPGEIAEAGELIPAGPLADAALVHRRRPENIVVSPLGYSVAYVPSEAVRTKRFEEVHCPLDVVEAARQFMILLSHSVCGFDLQCRLILKRLIVTMPQCFPRPAAVHLLSAQPRANRSQLDITIQAHCGTAPPATISWDISAVTPAVYARLRGAS